MHNVGARQGEHVRHHLPVDTTLKTGFNEPQKLCHSNELVQAGTVGKLPKRAGEVDIDKLFGHSFFDVESVGDKDRQNCHSVLKLLLRSSKLGAETHQFLKIVFFCSECRL